MKGKEMANIDDADYEVQFMKNHQRKVGFHIGFKVMGQLADLMREETMEINEKYPKSEYLKLWAANMTAFFFMFLLSFKVITVAIVPLYVLYLIALRKIFKGWKYFKYKMAHLWLMTLGTLTVEFIITWFIKRAVENSGIMRF